MTGLDLACTPLAEQTCSRGVKREGHKLLQAAIKEFKWEKSPSVFL